MCGFTGFTNPQNNSKQILKKMTDRIIHRGPDGEGHYTDSDIALGHRRLSIIDIDLGAQPVFNEDGSMVLVFNGEIYNYMDLRKELVSKGHVFKTNSDTEVLVHGYEEYGKDLPNKLRGMFAFVIWDKNNKELFGARDFFGIKPFYYALMNNTFMFGSEIKCFLEHPDFKKELNCEALENYLTFQYSVGPETFFKNVFRLQPGHYFVYGKEGLKISKYWEIKFSPEKGHELNEWRDKISDVMHDSAKAHKISDVEVGSFLSSGVDSSYIAAISGVDKTYTVGFDNGEKYNEISFAKDFSKAIGKQNKSRVISADDYWNSLETIQYHMDEPLADPAAVALYFVCKTAHEDIKVVLSGEGADEIFGGYNVYSEPGSTFYDRFPYFIRHSVGKAAEKLPSFKGRNFLVRKGKKLEERFIGNAYMFTPQERKALLKKKTNAKMPEEITSEYYKKVHDMDDVTKMQYLDLHMWMTGDILLKADKMSMANSLELRVPFLDRKVMEVASHIPVEYRVTRKAKTDDRTPYITKYAMRLAAKKDTPAGTEKTAAKKKLGFPVPVRVWLKEDKYYDLVKEKFTSDVSEQYFNTDILLKLLTDHKNGKKDNSRKIWTVFTFLIWYDVFFKKNDKLS